MFEAEPALLHERSSLQYEPPTYLQGWPTGQPLIDRLRIPRGYTVVTDGNGGWNLVTSVWLGVIQNLTEGVDYFLGGHIYEVSDELYASLTSPGPTPAPGSGSGSGGNNTPLDFGQGPFGEGTYGGGS